MNRAELMHAGFTVTSEKTGAEYPNFAAAIGPGWQYVLRRNGGDPRAFSTHQMAWAFAARLALIIEPQGPEGNGHDLPTCRACGHPGSDDHEDCPNCAEVRA